MIFASPNFDDLLSDYIKKIQASQSSASYLMRIRKALLSLHDFQQELTNEELLEVLINVDRSGFIHPAIQKQFSACLLPFRFLADIYNGAKKVMDTLSFFGEKVIALPYQLVSYFQQQISSTEIDKHEKATYLRHD